MLKCNGACLLVALELVLDVLVPDIVNILAHCVMEPSFTAEHGLVFEHVSPRPTTLLIHHH